MSENHDSRVRLEKDKHGFIAASVRFPPDITDYQREVVICACHLTHFLYTRGKVVPGLKWADDIEAANVSLQCGEMVRVIREIERGDDALV